jgi:hypothetical protein
MTSVPLWNQGEDVSFLIIDGSYTPAISCCSSRYAFEGTEIAEKKKYMSEN